MVANDCPHGCDADYWTFFVDLELGGVTARGDAPPDVGDVKTIVGMPGIMSAK